MMASIARSKIVGPLMAMITLLATPLAQAATSHQINDAVEKGVEWLYSEQKPTGNWEITKAPTKSGRATADGTQWGGLTAFAVNALLAAGEDPKDPRLKKGLDFIKETDMAGTYAIGLRAQCWPLLPPTAEIRTLAARDAHLLDGGLHRSGHFCGLYDYFCQRGIDPTWGDHSVSFYGVQGMRACAEMGVEISDDYWPLVDRTWRAEQGIDGGWSYRPEQVKAGQGHTMNMTASGVSVLFVCEDYLSMMRPADCHGSTPDTQIEAGLKWVDDNFADVNSDVHANQFHLFNYSLYAIERIGAASGRKFFGARDWYQDGADAVIKRQNVNGGWTNIPDTACAILFLVHGRAPVMFNKLQYEVDRQAPSTQPGDASAPLPTPPKEQKTQLEEISDPNRQPANWDERPRDAANIALWTGRQMERELAWEAVNLKVPVAQIHDAPILYIAGNQTLHFTPVEIDKLRTFVEEGGIILGNSDCGDDRFTISFKALAHELFPLYEIRNLEADHLIFTNEQYASSRWKTKPAVMGLSNGIRELMLLIPADDPSRYWQTREDRSHDYLHELAADIYAYSVDRENMQYRNETYLVTRDPTVEATKKIKIARLQYNGNWDPEPGAWRRMVNVLHNDRGVDASVQTVKLGEGRLEYAYKLAHFTGTGKFTLPPVQVAELRDYIDNGGRIVIDAAGGDGDFAASAEALLEKLYPDNHAKTLDEKSPVYFAGGHIEQVNYRRFAIKQMGGEMIHNPLLKGIKENGRITVIYSPQDLTEGMVGQAIDGVNGYQPESATALMANIVCMSAGIPATQRSAFPDEQK